jgi:chemotaxis family two-component system response regulator Rcp1
LLVEDDPAAAQLTLEALRDPRTPYHTTVVQDGEQALRFLHQESPYADAPRPDLIFLDLNLPKISGLDVLKAMREDPALSNIPVVVLSVSANPTDVEAAFAHHVAGYVVKHAELDQYFTAIRSLKDLWFNVMTLPKKARQPKCAAC